MAGGQASTRPSTSRRPVARWLALALVAAIAAACPTRAQAHPESSPVSTNRYLTLVALPDRLEIDYALLYGALPGAEERKRLDADGDGTVSPAELAAAGRAREAEAATLLSLRIDGRDVAPALAGDVEVGGDNRVGPFPLVVELRGSLPWAPGSHAVRVEPGREPPRLGETEVALDAVPGLRLVEAYAGAGAGLQGSRFKFAGPRVSAIEDRSVSARFDVAPAEAPTPSRWLDDVLLLLLGLAVGLLHGRAGPCRPRVAALHAVFPASTGALLAFARARLLGALPTWPALGAAVLALAVALPRSRRVEESTGHAATWPMALVPTPSALLLAVAGALASPLAAVGLGAALALGAALGARHRP